MQIIVIALMMVWMLLGLCGCTSNVQGKDEYDADHEAYTKCIENEPSVDDCVYDYVKYLPKEYQEQLED